MMQLIYLNKAAKSINKQLDEILKCSFEGQLIIGTMTKEGDAIFFAEKEDVYRFIRNPEAVIDIRELGLTYSECYDSDTSHIPLASRYALSSFKYLNKNEINKIKECTKGEDKEEVSIHTLITTKKEWERFKKQQLKPRKRSKIIRDKELIKLFSSTKKEIKPEDCSRKYLFSLVSKKTKEIDPKKKGLTPSTVKSRYYELHPKKRSNKIILRGISRIISV